MVEFQVPPTPGRGALARLGARAGEAVLGAADCATGARACVWESVDWLGVGALLAASAGACLVLVVAVGGGGGRRP